MELADLLAGVPSHGEKRGRPRQVYLRKAISAAYYAMFHALANSNADTLIGSGADIRKSEEWTAAHRALNHGTARKQMRNARRMVSFQADVQDFAQTFLVLQVQRNGADYAPNPDSPLTRSQTQGSIQRARDAIRKFLNAPSQERKRFASHLLFVRRV